MSAATLTRSTNGNVRRILIIALATLLLFTALAIVPGSPLTPEAQAVDYVWAGNKIGEHRSWSPDEAIWVPGQPKGYTEGEIAPFRVTMNNLASEGDHLKFTTCVEYNTTHGPYAFLGFDTWNKTYKNTTLPSTGDPLLTGLKSGFNGVGLTIDNVTFGGPGDGLCDANYLAAHVDFTMLAPVSGFGDIVGAIVYGAEIAASGAPLPYPPPTEVPDGMGASAINGVFQARVASDGQGDKTVNYMGQLIDPIPYTGTIEVIKALVPYDDPGLFDLQIDGTTKKADASDGDTTGAVAVSAGKSTDPDPIGDTHTVGEIAGTATDLSYYGSSISCVDQENDHASTSGSGPLNVFVEPNDAWVCTIVNENIAPTLTLEKTVVNNNGGTLTEADFPAFIDSTSVAWDAVTMLTAGTYTASETTQPGYAASVWGGDCDANGLVTLAIGEDKTCTITNNDIAPTLTLKKTVVNDDGGTLTKADFPAFVGTTSVAWDAVTTLSAGAYTASETPQPGYAASVWGGDCAANGSVTLSPGDNKTCTVVNDDAAPTLKLVKSVVNGAVGTAVADDWMLKATAGGDRDFGTKGGSGVFETVYANAAYVLSETGPAGYTAGSWSCDGGSLVGNTITLGIDTDVTCTIVNTKLSAITIVKVSIAGMDTFDFTSKTLGDFSLTTVSDGTDATAKINFVDLAVGTYDVAETVSDDWFLASATCDDGSDPAAIALGLGEHVTCTFTNGQVLATAQLGDTVWLDKNKNGVQDDGEPGINGAKVILKDVNGTVIATQITYKGPWDGFYKFLELEAGTYTAVLDLTSVTGELTTAGAFTVTLTDGEDYTKADFGVAEVLPKTGMDAAALALLGLALLAAGAVAVLLGRRRGEDT